MEVQARREEGACCCKSLMNKEAWTFRSLHVLESVMAGFLLLPNKRAVADW
jgi:hypothetical protein